MRSCSSPIQINHCLDGLNLDRTDHGLSGERSEHLSANPDLEAAAAVPLGTALRLAAVAEGARADPAAVARFPVVNVAAVLVPPLVTAFVVELVSLGRGDGQAGQEAQRSNRGHEELA